MLENLTHSCIYKEHSNNFLRAQNAIEGTYAGYRNKDKIIHLLNWWLFTIKALIEISGSDAAIKFSSRDSSSKSILIFSEYYDNGFIIEPKDKSDNIFISWFAYFYIMFARKVYLPAGKFNSTLVGRIVNRISVYFAKNLKAKHSVKHKNVLLRVLSDMYSSDPLLLTIINNKLPKLFYSEQINTWGMSELICDGSAHCFLDLWGYENLFLLDRHIVVIGRQHGGGYGVYQNDFYLELELGLCDQFIGWNLFDINEKKSILKASNSALLSGVVNGIIWVERPQLVEITSALCEYVYKEHNLRSPIEYIASELMQFSSIIGNLVYPNRITNIYSGLRFTEISRNGLTGEALIGNNNIIIFDMVLNSLIYYCINNNIRFIIVTNRELANFYSSAMSVWANELRENGQLVFDDELGLLKKLVSDHLKN